MVDIKQSVINLFGKKSSSGQMTWLPLIIHLADTAEVGALLWDQWLCDGAKRNIIAHTQFSVSDVEPDRQARSLFIFLCAVHDLGKATPAFQRKIARVSYIGTSEQSEREERIDACRDLDKAIMDRLLSFGFVFPKEIQNSDKTPHALCSQVLLKEFAGKGVRNIAAVIGAHHGKPQDTDPIESYIQSYPDNFYAGSKQGKLLWTEVQKTLCNWALQISGCFKDYDDLPVPNQVASVELCGLLIMADWISSNEYLFPYIHINQAIDLSHSHKRALQGFEKLGLTHPWLPLDDMSFSNASDEYFERRFGFNAPNHLQKTIIELARSQNPPGIFVIEAPMGYGKTETALAAAEILAKKSGRTGVFFALPTQATSNGIFPRLKNWVAHFHDSRCHSIELFHCRAEFNEDWKAIKDNSASDRDLIKSAYANGTDENNEQDLSLDDTIIVNDWFSGRKKAMLADFVVGTIDQLLMGAFKQKHLMLRHLGLVNKVVIIDECHAYDAYMSVYLNRILEWLGKYHIPTIVLSATLPCEKRRQFIELYSGIRVCPSKAEVELLEIEEMFTKPEWMTSREYPLVTYNNGNQVCTQVIPSDEQKTTVQIERLNDEDIEMKLAEVMKKGGCAGIIVNSVRRSQMISKRMREIYGDDKVILFHSRFLMPDRARIEKQIIEMLGKPSQNTHRPEFKIVIGTQVLEQSLDIDFDVLFTDLAPMDLLIQRIGRLHRHQRNRPEILKIPKCYVMGIRDNGRYASIHVYDNYLLMRTEALLPTQMTFPDDISSYVENTYNDNYKIEMLNECEYQEAYKTYNNKIAEKKDKAEVFRICAPNVGKRRSALNGWLSREGGDIEDRAAVRDISESLEVNFVQDLEDGFIHLPDDAHTPVSRNETPNDELAREILKYSCELPIGVIQKFDKTILYLEQCTAQLAVWQKSRWLHGNLFIILDKNGHFTGLPDFELFYSKSEGLSYIKKDQPNA